MKQGFTVYPLSHQHTLRLKDLKYMEQKEDAAPHAIWLLLWKVIFLPNVACINLGEETDFLSKISTQYTQ